MAVEDGRVAGVDLTRVVEDDNLGKEVIGTDGGIVLGVTSDEATADLLDGDVLDVEANVVTGGGLGDLLVVHLNGLDLSGEANGGEGHDHAGLDDTGLDATDGDSADTANLVDVLEGNAEGERRGALRLIDSVEGAEESGTLVPGHVRGGLEHVVTSPAGKGDEGDDLSLPSDALEELSGGLNDLLEALLRPHDGVRVHLVDGDDHLLDTEGEGEKGVLTGLAVVVDTSLELTLTGGNDENGNVGLRGTGDHVLDEVTVARGVDDGELVLDHGRD